MRRFLLTALIILACSPFSRGQEHADSLVRLMSAKSMELLENEAHGSCRKVTGPARFLHNGTYLLCDTAYWYVDQEKIECLGNVKIIQDATVLTGDKLTYRVPDDLAEFRGSVVQLEDDKQNMLRTRHLDYNTRDSVAVFRNGGAMMDQDGQVIESLEGSYDSKAKLFTFKEKVNMFTDSVFIKTVFLLYEADKNLARFSRGIDAWKDEYMLSSDAGWYDRDAELFFFRDNVHGLGKTQETWSDSVYYWRNTNNIEMLGNAQMTDSTRNVTSLAGHMVYVDSLSTLTLTREPAVIGYMGGGGASSPADTVYFGADSLIYKTILACDVPEAVSGAAQKRLEDLEADAVAAHRRAAYEQALRAAEEARKNDPNRPPQNPAQASSRKSPAQDKVGKGTETPPADTTGGTASPPPADSVSAPPPDSTKLGFLTALRNVRLFKQDTQMFCDSLAYNDLDSLVRLYREPYVWNEIRRQYTADSIYVKTANGRLQKANLLTSSFVIIEEEPGRCYDQVRSTEMVAYFDTTSALVRFDALGDANAIFYLKEDSTFATVNKSAAKMLSSVFVGGEIDRVYYFDATKNDAYPLAQMKTEDRQFKGFNWAPEKRPSGPRSITSLTPRRSQRQAYASRPRAKYTQTDFYFPGYMDGVYRQIRENKIARERRRYEEARQEQGLTTPADTSYAAADSLISSRTAFAAADSLAGGAETLPLPDSLARSDSLKSGAPVSDTVLVDSKAAQKAAAKAAAKAEKARRKEEKRAAKAREWARLDSLDAVKAQLKLDKKAAKERARKRKTLQARIAREQKDARKIQEYVLKLQEKKRRAEAKETARQLKKERKSAKKTSPPSS